MSIEEAFLDELEKIGIGKFRKGVAGATIALSTILPTSKAQAPTHSRPAEGHLATLKKTEKAEEIKDFSVEALEKRLKNQKPYSYEREVQKAKRFERNLGSAIRNFRQRVNRLDIDTEALKRGVRLGKKGKRKPIEDFEKILEEHDVKKKGEVFSSFIDELAKIGKYNVRQGPKDYKTFKKNQVPLTPEERALVMKRKAVWNFHFGKDGKRKKTSAVAKAIIDGKTWYETHTHRAINYAPTLKGAINRYHKFIKSTA